MQPRERLEPPAVTALERQLMLNAPSQQSRPNIQPVPRSSVLSKLKTFLPQMEQANAQLEQQLQSCDPSVLDIEHIPQDSSAPVIQMDLACGLLDLKDDAALAAAERAIAAGGEVAVETYDGAGGSSDNSDSDDTDSSSCSSDDDDDADGEGDAMEAEGSAAAAAAAAAAAGSSGQQAAQGGPAVAAGRTPGGSNAGSSSCPLQRGSEQHQQLGGSSSSRRRVKAKRPIIVELP